MRIIAIANHKGGVGKTATAQALGVALAYRGRRVLLVDTDPQSSLTLACGAGDCSGHSLADVLGGAQPGSLKAADVLLDLGDGLHILPSDISLAAVELGLNSRMGREAVLKKALAPLGRRFDVCLIDCPPSLGLLTVGALAAADGVLVPTQPQAVDLRGLRLFIETLDLIRAELNPTLETVGVLVTFYDGRLTHHQAAIEAIQAADLPLFGVRVGRSVRMAEAAGAGETILTWEPGNPRAAEYTQLAAEVEAWLKRNQRQPA